MISLSHSILTIYRTHPDGTVDGGWVQDRTGSLASALQLAAETSAVNSGMALAVVPHVGFAQPGDCFTNPRCLARVGTELPWPT